MIAQGNFNPGSKEAFAGYLTLFEPLLKEYDSATTFIGGGVPMAGTDTWDMMWFVRFPDEEKMRGFITDARVLNLRQEYEKKVYSHVSLSFYVGHSPIQL